MSKYDYDLIVIGGGAAGLTGSTGAAALGAKTLLIEKEEKLGGDCLHYGCVPSKSLIKVAHVYHQLRQTIKYGLPAVELPKVDMAQVMGRIQEIIDTIQVHDSPEYIKKKYNVDTQFGQAKFIDDHSINLNGKTLTAKNFFICTGSSPMVPLIEGLDQVNYLTNVNIFNIDYLPESLIVLGGGPIGLEMAQSFARLGSKVTVVEFADRIMSKEDNDVSEFITERLTDEGITFLTGHKAVKANQSENQISIVIENIASGELRSINAQTLLVATGRKANVEGLGLDNIGIKYTSRGIHVDNRLRTAKKHIYACGDVNGGLQFTHVAGYEGGIAMVNAIVKLPATTNYNTVPWVTYLDPEVASIGYNESMAKKEGIDYKVHLEPMKNNHRAIAERETDGFVKILIGRGDKPIGVQIVGANAGDLINEWVAILNGKVSLSTVAQAIHPYPTKGEINKIAAGNYLAPQFFENPVVKWLAKI